MSILKTIANVTGLSLVKSLWKGRAKSEAKPVRGAYDIAQNGDDQDHWGWADSLDANSSNSKDVRQTVRERSRYEVFNNSYGGGLVDKLGNDLVGTVPRLQLTIPGTNRKASRQIEKSFLQWSRSIGLGEKLRLLDNAAVRDGEGFAVFFTNRRLDPNGVQLDVRLYETDQVDTPLMGWGDDRAFPGGRIDKQGNVIEWHFLKYHPGSEQGYFALGEPDKIPAEKVIHWFKPRRAGQLRGIPEIASSLTLYAYLRRYTLATVAAAETAANLAGIMKTNSPSATVVACTPMKGVSMPRNQMLTLPEGWEATQFKPEQPVTGYKEFKGEILSEAGQSVGATRNVATGSSAEYNYSSARLDHRLYQRGIEVRRSSFRERVLDKIFRAWLDEASITPGMIPQGLALRHLWTWDWYYDGFVPLDPQKDAETNDMRLRNGTITHAEISAEDGVDWEERFEQRAEERRRLIELELVDVMDEATAQAEAQMAAKSPALDSNQVAALLDMADRLSGRALSVQSTEAIIQAAFPAMKLDLIRKFVRGLNAKDQRTAPQAQEVTCA